MTVLVTGAGGQLGMCLKEESVNYANLTFLFKNSKELDITKRDNIEKVFNENSIQYCVNCAAYTAVDKAETEKDIAFLVNAEAVKNLALVCEAHDVILIHISTDFVFDGIKSTPYTELDTPQPLSIYGSSKLMGETYITSILENYFIVRTSWLYSEFCNNFMKTMMRMAKEKSKLRIVSDQLGSPTYARDLAQALLQIIGSKKQDFGLYHYSNEGITSWYGFAEEIFKKGEIVVDIEEITISDYPTPAKRPRYSVLNSKKIIETFDLNTMNWKDSLKIAISNYRARCD